MVDRTALGWKPIGGNLPILTSTNLVWLIATWAQRPAWMIPASPLGMIEQKVWRHSILLLQSTARGDPNTKAVDRLRVLPTCTVPASSTIASGSGVR